MYTHTHTHTPLVVLIGFQHFLELQNTSIAYCCVRPISHSKGMETGWLCSANLDCRVVIY